MNLPNSRPLPKHFSLSPAGTLSFVGSLSPRRNTSCLAHLPTAVPWRQPSSPRQATRQFRMSNWGNSCEVGSRSGLLPVSSSASSCPPDSLAETRRPVLWPSHTSWLFAQSQLPLAPFQRTVVRRVARQVTMREMKLNLEKCSKCVEMPSNATDTQNGKNAKDIRPIFWRCEQYMPGDLTRDLHGSLRAEGTCEMPQLTHSGTPIKVHRHPGSIWQAGAAAELGKSCRRRCQGGRR